MSHLRNKIVAGLLGLLLIAGVRAETVTVQARYQPSQADFLDINPPGKLCIQYVYFCQNAWRAFSVDLPIEFSKPVLGSDDTAPPRDQYYIDFPKPAQVTITHDRTGERQQANLQFVAWEMGVYSPDPNKHPMNGTPYAAGCRAMGRPGDGAYKISGWRIDSFTPCHTSGGVYNGMWVTTQTNNVSAIIRLDTPNPHRMKHGMWRGSIEWTVGEGGQIDLGNGAVVNRGNTLKIEVELEVVHAFVLDFPPNSDKAVLQPDGGWERYWRGGPVPRRLFNEVPFRLWSSGPFKVYIECQRNMGTMCGLMHRPTAHQVPFSVALTLPPEHTHLGAPVLGQVLPVGQANALEFDSNATTWDRRGTLKYEVTGSDVIHDMLENDGATYSGLVWIIFDAEL
ncbi:hypothetical protein SFA35_15970 [Pseudomonas sp. HR96]|uniref:hypothetical protein n=1 Tax=Pseudomonas sp. HR96 TaxID=1027966 RepID=UPI002A7525F4|nr:hypothetical protein [Pseudomonas sp. HR96]WPO98145.1 hypothetical protein SFA35_15970 [Pseudomonas sp. HR96]